MQKISNIFKITALAILTAVLSTGCISEKYEVSGLQNVMIQLNVSTDADTKADPTSDELKINTLRIYAFRGNKLCGYHYQGSEYTGPVLMDLELPDGVSNVDFYLIANEAEMAYENGLVSLSENMSRQQLEDVKFTALAQRTALPMYCKSTESIDASDYSTLPNDVPGHLGHLKLNKSVNFILTRSLAKLSVYAAKTAGAATNPKVLKVNLLNTGTRQYSYLFPQSETTLDAVAYRANDRALLDAEVTVSKEVDNTSAGDPSNYDVILTGKYLPEVSAGYAADDPSYQWNISSGEENEAVLYIEYVLGAGMELQRRYVYLPRVERNDHIKVCILINAEGQLIINYVVADWDMEDGNMNNWFFDYPTHSYVRHSIPQSAQDLEESPSSAAEMSESKPFVGYFQMTYPANDTWKPTLKGAESSNATVKVFDKDDNLVFSSDNPKPLNASEHWYRIEVSPNAGAMTAGDKVDLAITYTPSGLEEVEYLLINGSYQNYFWPGSNDENFVTITMVN